MKRSLRILGILILLPILSVGAVILYGTLTEYKPEPGSHTTALQGQGEATGTLGDTLRLLNWNIGFGGLGAEMDFFYDGGKTVRAERELWDKDMAGIVATLRSADDIDLFLLQEVDIRSKRSYGVNQFDSLDRALVGFGSAFAVNYQVRFVPLPFTRPLGGVHSGVATYARTTNHDALRHQYPGSFPWPTRIFFLDRCVLVQTFRTESGKQLVVMNTHNSAYDETGEIKAQEMAMLDRKSVV